MWLPHGSWKSSEPLGRTLTPASASASRAPSLSSTTSPKCLDSSGGWERPADSAMNWSPMSMKAIRPPWRPRSSNSKKRPYQASASSMSPTSSAMWLMPTRRAMPCGVWSATSAGAGSDLRPLGLVGALRGLVVHQRLRRVDIAEGWVRWHESPRGLDAEALGQHGAERLDLHLAEAGKPGQ